MKKLMYMINFEFSQIIKKVLLLSLTMAIFQNLSFALSGLKEEYRYVRFEQLLGISGYSTMFYVFMLSLMVLQIYTFYKDYFGSKAIYTLMTLPSKRSLIYTSKYLAALLSVFMLLATQLLNVFITYGLYSSYYAASPRVNNGLYMAFVRDGFLQSIFPQDIYVIIFGVSVMLSAAAFPLYIIISLKSKAYLASAATALLLHHSLSRLNSSIVSQWDFPNLKLLIFWVLIVILANGFMINRSIKFIGKNSIL
jgi:hypothetical protein